MNEKCVTLEELAKHNTIFQFVSVNRDESVKQIGVYYDIVVPLPKVILMPGKTITKRNELLFTDDIMVVTCMNAFANEFHGRWIKIIDYQSKRLKIQFMSKVSSKHHTDFIEFDLMSNGNIRAIQTRTIKGWLEEGNNNHHV